MTYNSSCDGRKRADPTLPIIRVIQIDSPVFVHTDVANFRSTVQSLTGSGCASTKLSSNSRTFPPADAGPAPHGSPLYHNGTMHSRLDVVQAPKPPLSYQLSSKPQSSCSHDIFLQPTTSTPIRGFNDGDILAGLRSEQPLPDLSMLPPLHLHSFDDM